MAAGGYRGGGGEPYVVRLAREGGQLDDPRTLDLIGEARTLDIVGRQLLRRLALGVPSGKLSEHSPAVGRLFNGIAAVRQSTIAFEVAGGAAGTWAEDDGASADVGMRFLMRQAACMGGGTTEISRNVIAERMLGMPREPSMDRNVAFRDVPRGPRQKAAIDV